MIDTSAFTPSAHVAEVASPSIAEFREQIYPRAQPVILRGVVRDWDIVRASAAGTSELADYLKGFARGDEIDVLTAARAVGGRFFYDEGLQGFNFTRARMTPGALFDRLAATDRQEETEALYLEATEIDQILPGLETDNRLAHAPPTIDGRIWIGNGTTVQTHFDLSQNLACVASGRRRFTLFPPDQTRNLYMGPIERTPSGTPVSMVRLEAVDRERFPRFAEAENHALVADLAPGDALFIPYMWWHHAEATGPFNVLINYWWNEHDVLGSPMDTMLHAILTVRDLPPPMRDAWRAMFDHFVFQQNGPPVEHLPPALRGGLGPLSGPMRAGLWAFLSDAMRSQADRVAGRRR
jgi:hypothetical protein